MKYDKYSYRYPPRPELQIPPEVLDELDQQEVFLAQPKLNGSCMELFTNGDEDIVMNRHKKSFSNFKMDMKELNALHRGEGWMVLVGEYMNKNKKDETKKHWNQKFVIFDILVYNGEHMLRSTFSERQNLLNDLYPSSITKLCLRPISENCFRVQSIMSGFKEAYDLITPFDIYEGLVLKRKDGKLENGISTTNNTRTQLKCRKPTKNYSF